MLPVFRAHLKTYHALLAVLPVIAKCPRSDSCQFGHSNRSFIALHGLLTFKAKFHYSYLVADRSEAGRRPAASWNLTYHLVR